MVCKEYYIKVRYNLEVLCVYIERVGHYFVKHGVLTLVGEDTALSTELIAIIIIINSHSQTSLFVGFLLCGLSKKTRSFPLRTPLKSNKQEGSNPDNTPIHKLPI